MTSSILLLQEEASVWRTAERERRKLHTCHISCSIHATFTVTHTKGEESVRWGEMRVSSMCEAACCGMESRGRRNGWGGSRSCCSSSAFAFLISCSGSWGEKKKKRKSLFILSQAVRNASCLTLKVFTCADGKGRLMSAIYCKSRMYTE